MDRIVSTLLISLCATSAVLSYELPHAVVEKSFDDALRECAEYFLVSDCEVDRYYKEGFPAKHKVKQLIRCTLFNLNAYDDATGVAENVLGNFFKPCSTDHDYVERTRVCVKKALDEICPDDVYSRPYASFLCYYHDYGNIVSEAQFIPKTELETWQLEIFVESVLSLPYEVIVQYSEGRVLNEPHFPHAAYVFAVRGGYYTLDGGIQLARLYTQFGNPELLSAETVQCAAKVAQTYCNSDYVTKNYYTFLNCIHPYLPLENLVQASAQKQVACSKSSSAVRLAYK